MTVYIVMYKGCHDFGFHSDGVYVNKEMAEGRVKVNELFGTSYIEEAELVQ